MKVRGIVGLHAAVALQEPERSVTRSLRTFFRYTTFLNVVMTTDGMKLFGPFVPRLSDLQ